MATLKEILDDKAGFADNIAFTLAGGTQTTLGALRTLRAEEQNAVSKREEALNAQTKTFETQSAELKRAQVNTANAFTLVQKAMEALKSGNVNDPSIKQLFGDNVINLPNPSNQNQDPFAAIASLENDALLAPLVKVLKVVDSENKKAQKAVADNLEVQKRMATNYVNGVLEDRYDRLIPADKQDKFPLNELIQTAVANNAFRSDGTPDIKAAYRSKTAGDDLKSREEQIRADERKKVTEELQVTGKAADGTQIFVPQPNSFGLDVHNRGGSAPKAFESLDAAFAAAAKDKDIWNQAIQA